VNRLRALALAVLVSPALASCGLLEDDAPSASEVNSSDRVEVDGVSFDKPENWLAVEPDDLAKGADDESMDEVYDALNTDADAFAEILEQVDVYLVDTIGSTSRYADNISVLAAGGPMPDDGAVKAQYAAIGATNVKVRHAETALGTATLGSYDLDIGVLVVHGQSIVVDQDGVVVITIATQKPGRVKTLTKQILKTLDED